MKIYFLSFFCTLMLHALPLSYQPEIHSQNTIQLKQGKVSMSYRRRTSPRLKKNSRLKPRAQTSSRPQKQGVVQSRPAEYLSLTTPEYPWRARKHGWEDDVVIKVWLSKEGAFIRSHFIQKSQFEVFNQTVLETVRKAKFKPAQENQQFIDSTLDLTFSFRL